MVIGTQKLRRDFWPEATTMQSKLYGTIILSADDSFVQHYYWSPSVVTAERKEEEEEEEGTQKRSKGCVLQGYGSLSDSLYKLYRTGA